MSRTRLRADLRRAAANPRAPLPTPAAAVRDVLDAGPDREGALRRWADLPDPWLDAPMPPAAVRLLHEGPFVARMMAACPAARADLARPVPPPIDPGGVTSMLHEARRCHPDPWRAAAEVRDRVYLTAARLECEGAACEEVGAGLSALADVLVGALAGPELSERVVVFGMGKLAGRELNFLSDVDLVFVAVEGARGPDLDASLRDLVRRLERRGPAGPLYHVDLRLRPFGRRGPLALSADAFVSYFERHGQPWERQAWIRARPIAGRVHVGADLLERLRPFVYRRSVTPAIFGEIAEWMRIARRHAEERGGIQQGEIDVKHAAGGIREVEFFVQGLQLLHGGRDARLRTPSTLHALDVLLATGRITGREHATLASAYRFLRRVEHRIQIQRGAPGHTLPADPDARIRLAASLLANPSDLPFGPAPGPTRGKEAGVTFTRMVRCRLEAVTSVTATLMAPADTDGRTRDRSTAADAGAPRADRVAALARLGLSSPEEAEGLLAALLARPSAPFRGPPTAQRGARRLLDAVLDSSDPDTGLVRMAAFMARHPGFHPLWSYLATGEPDAHSVASILAELLAVSEPLSHALIHRAPARIERRLGSVVEMLLWARRAAALPDRKVIEDTLKRMEEAGDPPATVLHLVRWIRLKVALFDLAHDPGVDAVGRALTDLADVAVGALLGAPPHEGPVDLSVVGLGKLGRRTMDYGSDLDLVFLYDPPPSDPASARGAATRTARRLLRALAGPVAEARLFETDLRLRPFGGEGPLVTGAGAFADHHRKPRPLWDRIPWLHARPVAGLRVDGAGRPTPAGTARPPWLERFFRETVPAALWAAPLTFEEASAQLAHIRDRIQREVARERHGRIHVKAGRGGPLDLELAVDTLCLLHRVGYGAGRPFPLAAQLDELVGVGALSASEASELREAHRFQRRVLCRLRLGKVRDLRDPESIAPESPVLEIVARRLGLADPAALVQRLHQYRAAVARIVELRLRLP